MTPVIWTPRAIGDLERIVLHIADHDVGAAFALSERILERVEERLPHSPKIGRPGRVPGTRELVVHRNYIAAYRVTDAQIDVLAVRHAAQLWPETF